MPRSMRRSPQAVVRLLLRLVGLLLLLVVAIFALFFALFFFRVVFTLGAAGISVGGLGAVASLSQRVLHNCFHAFAHGDATYHGAWG